MSACSSPWREHPFTSAQLDEFPTPTACFGASPTGSSWSACHWRSDDDTSHGELELLRAETAHLKQALVQERATRQRNDERHSKELATLDAQHQAALACKEQELEHCRQQATCMQALLDELLVAQETEVAGARDAGEQQRRVDEVRAQLAAAARAQAAAERDAAQARRRLEEAIKRLHACGRQADAAGARASARATAKAAGLAAELAQMKQDMAAMQAMHQQQLSELVQELEECEERADDLQRQVQERDVGIARLQRSCDQLGIMLQDANRARAQPSLPVVRLSQLKLKQVAEGGYSTVHRTTFNGRDVAVKLIKPSDRISLMEEVAKAQRCKGVVPDVLCLVEDDVCLLEGTACLRGFAMEWWDGSLDDLLRQMVQTGHLRKLHWCTQLAELVGRLHDSRIAHLDLKAANILYRVSSTGALEFNLTDLGLAQTMHDDGTVNKPPCGTTSHNDPDAAPGSSGRYNGKAFDTYSLARTFMQILLGIKAFDRDWRRRWHIDASMRQALRPLQLRAVLQDSFEGRGSSSSSNSSGGGSSGCSTTTSYTSSSSGSSYTSSNSSNSSSSTSGSSGGSISVAEQGLQAGWVALLESMTGAADARPSMSQVAGALRVQFRLYGAALAAEAVV